MVFFALGGHREHVADEQLGDEPLVVVTHLQGSVHPADRLAGWRLGLDQHQRQAVDQQHQVGAALGGSGAVDELLGHYVLVLLGRREVDQAYRHMLVVRAERHGALAAHPGGHFLVGADHSIRAHRQHDGAQLVEHIVGTVGLLSDIGVQADQRGAQPGLDQHLLDLARHLGGCDMAPADALAADTVGRCCLLEAARFGGLEWAGKQIADIGFDGVGFSETHTPPLSACAVMAHCIALAASTRRLALEIAVWMSAALLAISSCLF